MYQHVSSIHLNFIDKMLVNCSICLGDINLLEKEVSIINCGHFYHTNCMNGWLDQRLNCPECRATVTRGQFARNIFPKVTYDIFSHLKSLKNKYDELKDEYDKLKDECDELKYELRCINFLREMENSTLKESMLIIKYSCIYDVVLKYFIKKCSCC